MCFWDILLIYTKTFLQLNIKKIIKKFQHLKNYKFVKKKFNKIR